MNLVELLLKPIIAWCTKTGRVFDITGTGGPEDVYLRRYYVVQSKWFNIFIHIFFRSDRDDMHDHPWDFATFVVRGGYKEQVPVSGYMVSDNYYTNNRYVHENRWAIRKATQLHRVMLPRNYSLAEKDQAPMTICITGRTKREWGFMKKIDSDTEQWIPWKKYLGLPDDAPTRG